MINAMAVEAKDEALKSGASLKSDNHWHKAYQKMGSLLLKQTILKLTEKVYSGALTQSEVVEVLTMAAQGDNSEGHFTKKAMQLSKLLKTVIEEYVWGFEFIDIQKWLLFLLTEFRAR